MRAAENSSQPRGLRRKSDVAMIAQAQRLRLFPSMGEAAKQLHLARVPIICD
jgi:hypothetical protein